MKNITCRG